MNPSSARPIFVIGLNRSGTKWLSNELAKHPDIACVLSEKTGIRETNMFRGFGRKFDLTKFDDYVGLIELWSTTDFFERTGVDKQRLLELDPLPRDPYGLFAGLMELFAAREQKPFWLQKGPPIAGLELIDKFPNASFVAVRRNMHDQIRSHLKLTGNRSYFHLARATFAYVRDMQLLARFCRKTRCPIIEYRGLEDNKEGLIAELFQSLGLTPSPLSAKVGQELIRNSSFQTPESKEQYLSGLQRNWISALAALFRWIPYPIMYWNARRAWNRLGPLIPGTFDNIHRRLPLLRDRFRDQG